MFSKNLLIATAAVCFIGGTAGVVYGQWPVGIGQPKVLFTKAGSLRIEIPISNELSGALLSKGLKLSSPDAYRRSGLEFPAVLEGADVTLEVGAGNKVLLVIKTKVAVRDAFLDLMLEWVESSGAESRVYSLVVGKPNIANTFKEKPITTLKSETPRVVTQSKPAQEVIESLVVPMTQQPASGKYALVPSEGMQSKSLSSPNFIPKLILKEVGANTLGDGVLEAKELKQFKRVAISFENAARLFQSGDLVELLLNGYSFERQKLMVINSMNASVESIEFNLDAADLGSDGEKRLTAQIRTSDGMRSILSSELYFALDSVDVVEATDLEPLAEVSERQQQNSLILPSEISEPIIDRQTIESTAISDLINSQDEPSEGSLELLAEPEQTQPVSVAQSEPKPELEPKPEGKPELLSLLDLELVPKEVPVPNLQMVPVQPEVQPEVQPMVSEVKNTADTKTTMAQSQKQAQWLVEAKKLKLVIRDVLGKKIITVEWPKKTIRLFTGDKVEILINRKKAVHPIYKILTSDDIKAGYVELELNKNNFDSEKEYTISAELFDQAGNQVLNDHVTDAGLNYAVPQFVSEEPVVAKQPEVVKQTERVEKKSEIPDSSINKNKSVIDAPTKSVSSLIEVSKKETPVKPESKPLEEIPYLDLDTENLSHYADQDPDEKNEIETKPEVKELDQNKQLNNVNLSDSINDKTEKSGMPLEVLDKPINNIFTGRWLNAEQAKQSQTIRVNLKSNNLSALIGKKIELLLGGIPFAQPKIKVIDAQAIAGKYLDFMYVASELGLDGLKQVYVRLIDEAGNPGLSSLVAEFEVDTLAPDAPDLAELNTSDLADGWLNAAEADKPKTFRLTLPKQRIDAVVGDYAQLMLEGGEAQWEKGIYLSEGNIQQGYVDFIVNPKEWGRDGSRFLSARLIDRAGNIGSSSRSVIFKIATVKPIAPVIKQFPTTLGAKTYLNTRTAGKPIKFRVEIERGKFGIGDEIELTVNHLTHQQIKKQKLNETHNQNNFVEFFLEPMEWGSDGVKLLTARMNDQAGNSSANSEALQLVVDRKPPSSLRIEQIGSDTLIDGWLNAHESNKKLQIRVSLEDNTIGLEPGSQVELLINEKRENDNLLKVTSAIDEVNRYIDFDLSLNGLGTDGLKTISARIQDPAGNYNKTQRPLVFQLDTQIPAALEIKQTGPLDLDDGWLNSIEMKQAKNFRIFLNKHSDVKSGDKIDLLINDKVVLTKEVGAVDLDRGYVDCVLGSSEIQDDGFKAITVRMTDLAGNVGQSSSKIAFNVDTKAPKPPPMPEVWGVNSKDGFININEAKQIKSIRASLIPESSEKNLAEPGDQLELLLNGAPFTVPKIQTLKSDHLKAGFIDLPLNSTDLGADGEKKISARYIDKAGNYGFLSKENHFTLIQKIPITPELLEYGSGYFVDNWLNSLEVSKEINLRVPIPMQSQVIEGGDVVEILLNQKHFLNPRRKVLIDTDLIKGYVDFNLSGIELGGDGDKSLVSRIVDKAGNIGKDSRPINFTVDTKIPPAPTLKEKNTNLTSDGFINKKEKLVGLVLEANLPQTSGYALREGDTIELSINGLPFHIMKKRIIGKNELSSGKVEFRLDQGDLGDDGVKMITAHITSLSGNVGKMSQGISFELDTQAPPSLALAEVETVDLADGWMSAKEAKGQQKIRVYLTNKSKKNKITRGDSLVLLSNGSPLSSHKSKIIETADLNKGFIDFNIQSNELGGDGDKELAAIVIDRAGNQGDVSAGLKFTLDMTYPNKPAVKEWGSDVFSDGWLNAAEVNKPITVRVSLPRDLSKDDERVELLLNGMPFNKEKSRSLDMIDRLNPYVDFELNQADLGADGFKSISSRVIDKAGNVGGVGNSIEFKLKTLLPETINQFVR